VRRRWLAALAVAIALGAASAYVASVHPDTLERTADDLQAAGVRPAFTPPLPGARVPGLDAKPGGALAGALGVAATALVLVVVLRLLVRRRARAEKPHA
jgi:hypothetical protein